MSSVYDRALKLLKIRPHHSEELTKKLLMRGFNRDEVDEVLRKLQEENLIDNESFAQMYLDELLRNKTFGFYMLKAKLMLRGIASNDAENLLKESLSVEDEKLIAMKIVGQASGDRQHADKMKLAQKLQRRGFRSEVIREVID